MDMNRRSFAKYTGIGLLGLTINFESCTASSVFNSILTWIPIGVSAIQGIVTLLGALVPPQATAIITLVNAGFASLLATVTQYENDTNPADKATILAKIHTILADIVTNFKSFLGALNLGNNPIEAIVIGLANIILAAIAGFINQLPVSNITTSMSYKLDRKSITVIPKYYKNVAQFKLDYNTEANSHGHPELDLK
jgi:hypothetical protein